MFENQTQVIHPPKRIFVSMYGVDIPILLSPPTLVLQLAVDL